VKSGLLLETYGDFYQGRSLGTFLEKETRLGELYFVFCV